MHGAIPAKEAKIRKSSSLFPTMSLALLRRQNKIYLVDLDSIRIIKNNLYRGKSEPKATLTEEKRRVDRVLGGRHIFLY